MQEPSASHPAASAFRTSRLQALARLAAYVLIFEYLLNLVFTLLPFSSDPNRLFAQITSALDTSSLPLIALPLLFAGFCAPGRAARWEWCLGRRLKPLLLLVALLYLVCVPALWWLGGSIQASGDRQIQQQISSVLEQLAGYRGQVQKAPDSQSLRRLLDAQPQLRLSLQTPDSPFAAPGSSLPQQQAQALRLVDRIRSNLQADGLRRRSTAAAELRKQELRLSGIAIAHALFFALGGLIWPKLKPDASPSL